MFFCVFSSSVVTMRFLYDCQRIFASPKKTRQFLYRYVEESFHMDAFTELSMFYVSFPWWHLYFQVPPRRTISTIVLHTNLMWSTENYLICFSTVLPGVGDTKMRYECGGIVASLPIYLSDIVKADFRWFQGMQRTAFIPCIPICHFSVFSLYNTAK